MDWKEFAASVIGDLLSWPVMALVIVLLLLKPIRKLIGRVRGARGFGAEVEFGKEVKNVENNVYEVLDEETESEDGAARTTNKTSSKPLDLVLSNGEVRRVVPDPTQDPSGAILVSWEGLLQTLTDLARTGMGRGRPPRSPSAVIAKLSSSGVISDSFLESVTGLRNIRDQVAHGQVNPSSGVARTYFERAGQLDSVAQGIIDNRKEESD